jgi:hypothetical protein
MTTWTRLATVALTAVGLVGLGNEAAAQCVTLHSGTPAMIVLSNPVVTQPAPAATTNGTTTTAQGTTTTTQGSTTAAPAQTITPAGGVILPDGRVVPAAVTGTTSYYTPGSYFVDANGNPIAYPSQVGTPATYYWPNGAYTTSYINGSSMYAAPTFISTANSPERRLLGMLRRR